MVYMNTETKQILLVQENTEYSQKVIEQIKLSNNYFIKNICDGDLAIKELENNHYDLVITDLVLPIVDGFEVLEKIAGLPIKPKVLVLSSITQDAFISKAMDIGCDYFLPKSTTISLLIKRINELFTQETKTSPIRQSKNRVLDEKISNIFITVGIPAHIKGYQFLREAIKMAIDNPEIINSITKQLYPSIANRFETSASKVERAIRHAIEVAWNRGKIENINNLFGIKVYSSNEKPTNGEFIALVADKMLIEGA